MNLVAACNDRSLGDRAATSLLAIGMRHPARAIVIVADPEGDPQLDADISLQCSADGRRVCVELVRLDVRGEPAYHLTSIVTPLLIPDMPVQLWIAGAPPLRQAFSAEAVELTESIILDTGAYADALETLTLLDEQYAKYGDALVIADIAWQRTAPWREAMAQTFDPLERRGWLRTISAVRLQSDVAAAPAEAWLLAGWLASRLGWHASASPDVSFTTNNDAAATRASVAGAGERARLRSVNLEMEQTSGKAQISIVHDGKSLRTTVTRERDARPVGIASCPDYDEADLISAMMAEAGADTVYRAAVSGAVALARRQRAG